MNFNWDQELKNMNIYFFEKKSVERPFSSYDPQTDFWQSTKIKSTALCPWFYGSNEILLFYRINDNYCTRGGRCFNLHSALKGHDRIRKQIFVKKEKSEIKKSSRNDSKNDLSLERF